MYFSKVIINEVLKIRVINSILKNKMDESRNIQNLPASGSSGNVNSPPKIKHKLSSN